MKKYLDKSQKENKNINAILEVGNELKNNKTEILK